ncbi:MAG: 1-deoxy-D-xylulose-5-phosphate synthase [Clostridia bacterium]|nr:1-deoxy-D-xylulose-5-phosphate synthase [Clostridia bacterium]
MNLLETIHSPEDLKGLTDTQLEALTGELRETIVDTVSRNGGHLASNLGAVELTLAMHLEFDSPKDSFVWDVGHKVYTHKLLTGRYGEFHTLRQNGGLSGFPNPEESDHDVFAAGHSGASIAAGYGLSVAKDLQEDPSYTVAVIGDGSFTGGLVYEALNNAGHEDTRLIVVLNDNEMSISPNVGSLAMYLAAIRTNPGYYLFKDEVRNTLEKVPVVGDTAVKGIVELKRFLKDRLYSSNMFEDMGFHYMGPIDGHDLEALRDAFRSAKTIHDPVILHVRTMKGKGYLPAEQDPSRFHGIGSFNKETGESPAGGTNFSSEFGKSLCAFAEKDERIVAITAAMALGTGLEGFAKRFPDRFFDVGIAEEFAVTFAGGLAKGGLIPVFAVYSTFLQRTYDEIVHDVAMQNQKVVLAVDRAGFVGDDGRSHQGIFDLAFLRTIPGSVIYSPSTYKGVGQFLYRAFYDDGKVIAVRYPRGKQGYIPSDFNETTYDDFSVLDGEEYYAGTELADKEPTACLVTFGSLFPEAAKARDILKDQGVRVRIVKLNKVWPSPEGSVKAVLDCDQVFFYEEGAKSGGIGESFGFELLEQGYRGNYRYIAVDNTFVHHAKQERLREEFGLDADSMVRDVKEVL